MIAGHSDVDTLLDPLYASSNVKGSDNVVSSFNNPDQDIPDLFAALDQLEADRPWRSPYLFSSMNHPVMSIYRSPGKFFPA